MPLRPVIAALMILLSLAVLEVARHGVEITRFDVGQTPVTAYQRADADGPVVVMAHGFAGSQQMMQGYALPLARAGYRVHVFDFLGHGRHPVPMSGDVTAEDGTTQLLVAQVGQVIDAVATGEGPVALLGHSMATDVLVRVAAARSDIGPLVLLSAFSREITAEAPADLLIVTGAWEPGLRDFAVETLRMRDPETEAGETVAQGDDIRRAVIAPYSEHVSILHSRVGRQAALDWLNHVFGRSTETAMRPTGWAILGLLAGLVLSFRPLSRLLPENPLPAGRLTRGQVALAVAAPTLLAPLVAAPLEIAVLPVLVADYLALHMALFGAVQLAVLRACGVSLGRLSWPALGLLLLACAVFGFSLDRHAANFWPTPERLWIIAAVALGAVPCMLADATLTLRLSAVGRLLARAGFLASLGIAVALDFEGLFFLIMIAPVLVLFYLVFGTMGRHAARRTGPLAPGLALGLVLAWALGVSFPLFQA
ncbi:alpha/beta hydrolase [Pseudoponticoccus marisrubri]|uniref:Alpha/beta hydrolase n=1 Tax=Pseudoponticoccus marisrubri TaxID=1685382 RepID=A0A0W7WI74_9RHOB|nr:alpha/beta fold hydrolase [Pseudoponticoccus marisrubri]KUF10265.1 alpha/beta hydrolase [Pseudoponticoccus marisrubri]